MQIRCVYLDYISLLGSLINMWMLLEDACTELDVRMAEENHSEGGVGTNTFVQYSATLQQRSCLKAQLESQLAHVTVLEQLVTYLMLNLPNPESSEPLLSARREASLARSRAEKTDGKQHEYAFIHYNGHSYPNHSLPSCLYWRAPFRKSSLRAMALSFKPWSSHSYTSCNF